MVSGLTRLLPICLLLLSLSLPSSPLPSPTNLSASTFSTHACTSSIYPYFNLNVFLDTSFVRFRTTSTPLNVCCLNLHMFLTVLRMSLCLPLSHSYNLPSNFQKHPLLPLNLPTPIESSSRHFRDLSNTNFSSSVCPTIVLSWHTDVLPGAYSFQLEPVTLSSLYSRHGQVVSQFSANLAKTLFYPAELVSCNFHGIGGGTEFSPRRKDLIISALSFPPFLSSLPTQCCLREWCHHQDIMTSTKKNYISCK